MHRIDGAGHDNGQWVAEDPATSRPPTEITAPFMNAVQEEISAVIEAHEPLDKARNNQLLMAIIDLIAEYSPGVELATVAETITGIDTVKATHSAGVKAAISSAIAGLVNSSPAALDTLNELAAALGNDASFAVTVTNALALKLSIAALQGQANTAFTTGGATGVYTLTPVPALSAYASNQRFRVKFHAAGTGTDTLNISSLGAKSLKQYDSSGGKVAPVIKAGLLTDIEFDGVDLVIRDPLPTSSIKGTDYNDVTALRALATPYTNDLNQPIEVSVNVTMPSTGQLIGKVNGVAIAWSNSQQSGNDTGFRFVVGAGKTYRIDPTAGSPTLLKWIEIT